MWDVLGHASGLEPAETAAGWELREECGEFVCALHRGGGGTGLCAADSEAVASFVEQDELDSNYDQGGC